jgi:hypothetical protein
MQYNLKLNLTPALTGAVIPLTTKKALPRLDSACPGDRGACWVA